MARLSSLRFISSLILGLLPVTVVASAPPNPDVVPLCNSPQDIAPMQLAGGNQIAARSGMAWNGQDFGVAWVEGSDNHLHFRRIFADGTPASPGVTVSTLTGVYYNPTSLIWNGSGYAVAWGAVSPSGFRQIYFARLTPAGALIGSEVKASFVGQAEVANLTSYAALAFSGAGYAVVWQDDRNPSTDVYATLLNLDGTIANAGASHDLDLTVNSAIQSSPSVAWDPAYRIYTVVWHDLRSAAKYEIWGCNLYAAGSFGTNAVLVSGSINSEYPSLADTGNGLGLSWEDNRDGNWEIYFAQITPAIGKIGSDLRLTNDTSGSFYPRIVWTGGEFGVFWQDARGGQWNAWFQRVSASGTLPGGAINNVQVTFSAGGVGFPDAAFAEYGYLAVGTPVAVAGANFVQALGCNYASTPPCPDGMTAYNVTGSTATVAWVPVYDYYNDIAYYQVYRNGTLVAKTSDNFYADTGLSLSTTYDYQIRAVNAAQILSQSCGTISNIYVKTNATLLLMVNGATPNAILSWTDSQPLASYNVFRGTSPQVMQKIGTVSGNSFTDPSVMMDNNIYFYTVDDPGQ